jgi:hypothetical protein
MTLTYQLVTPHGTPRYRNAKIGRIPQRFDVGDGRTLTAQQIATAGGLTLRCVYGRIYRGVTGPGLLAPAQPKCVQYDVGGRTMTAGAIAKHLGVHQSTVSVRISSGLRGRALLGKAKPNRRRK